MTVGGDRPDGVPTPADANSDAYHPGPDTPRPAADPDDEPELLPSSRPFRTVMRAVGIAEQSVGLALIVVILFLVLVQVAQRYVDTFGGWPWTGEVARLSLVWCTFALTGYLMAQDRHITIRVIDLALPDWALDLVKLLAHLVVLATCLGMGYATYRLIADDIGQRTPAAEIPLALVYVMPLMGYLLTGLRAAMVIGLVDLPEMRERRRAT
jgi:TRAP-type C4-dicarboxylate transport system permease small subunit